MCVFLLLCMILANENIGHSARLLPLRSLQLTTTGTTLVSSCRDAAVGRGSRRYALLAPRSSLLAISTFAHT